jgi:hypothetical protein
MVCEKCWQDAAERVMLLGGSQVERYRELLKEREENPCPPSATAEWPTALDEELGSAHKRRKGE